MFERSPDGGAHGQDLATLRKLGFQLPTPKLVATMKTAAREAYE